MNTLQTVNVKKYIEIDSTYRNRNVYPLQSQFKINVGNSGQEIGLNNAKDPITEGTSEWTWNGIGPISVTGLDGVPNAVTFTNLSSLLPKRGYFLRDDTTNELALVESMILPLPSHDTALLETPFSDAWTSGGNGDFVVFEDSTHVYFPFPEDQQDNAFNGWYLTQMDATGFNSSRIIGYSQKYSIMTLETALPSFSDTGTFELSKAPVIDAAYNPVAGVWSGNQAELGPNASSDDDFYNGMIIKFINRGNVSGAPPDQGVIFPTYYTVIEDYDGATRVATLRDPVPNYAAARRAYSISQYTEDVYSFLNVSSSYENRRRLYRVSCNNLILPNVPLAKENGGRPAFYPYVYVTLSNTSIGTFSLISSNNPNSQRAVFRCPIGDTDNPTTATFIKVRSEQIQTFEFNIYEDIKFEVYLPDGTLFQTSNLDTISPIPPNPNLQISAVFSFELIQ